MYCKHQGNMEPECTIKRKDEDLKNRKEWESQKKSKSEQEKGGHTNSQVQDKSYTEAATKSHQNTNHRGLRNDDGHSQGRNQPVSQQHGINTLNPKDQDYQESYKNIGRHKKKRKHKNQDPTNSKFFWMSV